MQTKDNAVTATAQQILNQVRKAVVGKDPVLLWVLAAIMAKGHILLEDIPGVGKTTMALAFSKVLDLDYSRVQFTPDVLPSDLIFLSSNSSLLTMTLYFSAMVKRPLFYTWQNYTVRLVCKVTLNF